MPNNIGAFGENFPYSNQHDMNMDWVIKIAKDFLDQYTQIQQMIADGIANLEDTTQTGLTELQEKYTELNNLLQSWYDTHSEDIANQLASALADLNEWYETHEDYLDETLAQNIATFQSTVNALVASAIASIPSDYSDFYGNAIKWMRYATNLEDALTLPIGVYGLGANNLPSNLPENYSGNGLIIVPDKSATGSVSAYRMVFSSYGRKFWYHTGYSWVEVLTSASLSEYYKYKGTLPDNTDPRNAEAGLYNLIPTRTYLNMPPNYDTSGYGWCMVYYQQTSSGVYVLLSDGENLWQAIGTTGWRSITVYNTLKQERITLIGDSLTEVNSTASKNWTLLMEDAGFTIQNLGKGGTGFARSTQTDGNYSTQIDNIDRNCTMIGVSASFNDLATSYPVGNVTDTGNTTLCGFINNFFNSLTNTFPTTPIVCYVLTPWGTANYGDSKTRDYCEKLEEICKERNIPFKSLLTCSTVRPWQNTSRQYYYNNDAVHPNNRGHMLIFRHILPLFMESCMNGNDMYYSIGLLNA